MSEEENIYDNADLSNNEEELTPAGLLSTVSVGFGLVLRRRAKQRVAL